MILLLALLTFCSSLFAQSSLISEADSLFRAGDYERVELLVLRAERATDVTTYDLVGLHLVGGYSMIMLDRPGDARRHFRAALDADSSLTLDPITVSPKFRVVFDEVKQQWQMDHAAPSTIGEIHEETTYHSARRESHLLNLLIPGAGFLREGRTARGAIHMVAQVAITALWLSEIHSNNSAREDYLAASTSPDASSLYDTYDSHHRRMWTYGLTTAAVYVASQVDLALWRKSTTSVSILPDVSGARLQFSF